MQRIFHRSARRVAMPLLVTALFCGCESGVSHSTGVASSGVAASARGSLPPATQSSRSILSPTLDVPFAADKSVAWCATMQMAWDALATLNGGSFWVQSEDPQATSIAAGRFSLAWIDPDSYVLAAGPLTPRLNKQYAAELRQRFGDDAASDLMPPSGGHPGEAGRGVAMAMLKKAMPFATAFKPQEMTFLTSAVRLPAPDVRAFGATRKEKTPQPDLDQVRILWRTPIPDRGDDGFDGPEQNAVEVVLELATTGEGDRLLLAQTHAANLRDATLQVMSRIAQPNTKPLSAETKAAFQADISRLTNEVEKAEGRGTLAELQAMIRRYIAVTEMSDRVEHGEVLAIPVVRLSERAMFPGLTGPVGGPQPVIQEVVRAEQIVQFELNERGAELRSEAVVEGLFGGGILRRSLEFNRPFLILLLRRGAPMPYFAMWVGGRDVLVPVPEQAKPQGGNEGPLFGDRE